MATTPRQQIASPQSFTSDPLESIFAKQSMEPITGGMAMANMIFARDERHTGQDEYLKNLHMTNALAAQLAQQDMRNDLLKESLQQTHHYIGMGVDPATSPIMSQLFSRPDALSGPDQTPALRRALTQSEITKNNAAAAAHGQEGAPKVKIETTYDANGTPVQVTTVEGKGIVDVKKLTDLSASVGATTRDQRGDPNFRGDPNAPYKSRTADGVSAAVGENFQQRHGRPIPTTPPFTGR